MYNTIPVYMKMYQRKWLEYSESSRDGYQRSLDDKTDTGNFIASTF